MKPRGFRSIARGIVFVEWSQDWLHIVIDDDDIFAVVASPAVLVNDGSLAFSVSPCIGQLWVFTSSLLSDPTNFAFVSA